MKRVFYFDVIKVLAMLCVIACHASLIFKGNPLFTTNLLHYINMSVAHIGVPLYVMVSGALILSKPIDDKKTVWRFYLHNLVPIVTTGIIWSLIYFCCNNELEHSIWGGKNYYASQ